MIIHTFVHLDIDDNTLRNRYGRYYQNLHIAPLMLYFALLATLMTDEAVFKIRHKVRNWLRSMKCSEYEEIFEKHGYFKLSFVAEMKAEVF